MDSDAVDAVGRVPHGSSDDPALLDFSANTNPEVPDGVEAVYRDALSAARSYPPEPPTAYCEAAAAYVGCDPESVVPTAGGLAAIRLTIDFAVESGDSVLVPAPSFSEYAREVRLQGADPVFVDQSAVLDADPAEHALAIVCNPNNPTGNAYDEDALRAFVDRCRAAGTLVLVDEAFLDFTDQPSLAGTDGVVVARSLTKMFGLPGIRAGFAVATGQFGEQLATARRPWTVGTPALQVGTYCLNQHEFVDATRRRVQSERERMREELSEQFDVHPSTAPFLLCDVGDRDVGAVLAAAERRGIALRDARTFRGLDSHIRVAVRLPAENDRLLAVIDDV
jgi:L-threonine-O-3-phosphate decarboxylase